ncbi:hypothetical protein ACJMK2_029351 [Sinanodonta woodiana]|uniref:Uncharacterized protein n=1 Tax=Sinanodonta woodiana TaxID=1069815 RepID=A0ABD3XDI6_SINWO
MQTKTRSNVHESLQDRTFKKMTRTTPWGVESDLKDDSELIEEDGFEVGEPAYRVPVKNDGVKKTQNTVKGGAATLKIKKEDMTEVVGNRDIFSRECPYKQTTLGIDGLRSNLRNGELTLQGKSVSNPTDCNYEALNEIGLAPRA